MNTDRRLRRLFGALLLWRLSFPFFESPLRHLFSDPARHWANAGRFLDPDFMGASDPFLYQLWLFAVRRLSGDAPVAVLFACGLLCAAMPYGWYRALRELLPRRGALWGALAIGLMPAFFGIYAYFMNETLLLTLTGFAFWLSFRAHRKDTRAAWLAAVAVWSCASITRLVALPIAVLCLGAVWSLQRDKAGRALLGALVFFAVLLPAGLHSRATLGFFAPFGNTYPTEIYLLSGRHDIAMDTGSGGRWYFGSPSFYNPSFYPFSDWTTDRRGTVNIRVDLARGRADWITERERVRAESDFGWWSAMRENLIFLFFAQSWPDNDRAAWSGELSLWSRWLWPPLLLAVIWGVWRRRFRGPAWLLPASALAMMLLLCLQRTSIVEGRYVKPLQPILLAAAIVMTLG